MNDRELLELAAKAAGYNWDAWGIRGDGNWWTGANYAENWNPLTDDGDALRLAVKLQMCVSTPFCYSATAKCADVKLRVTEQECGDDQYAATRRAIVRAAAAIEEAMP